MTGSTSFWILIGAAAVALVASLLLGGGAVRTGEPATEAAVAASTAISARSALVSRPPTVDVGDDVVIGERAQVQLAGSVTDPGGGPVSVRWSAEGGLGFFENVNSAQTTYTAPSSCDCETSITLTLTATNSAGLTASDRLVVRVRDPLRCPAERSSASGGFLVSSIDLCATGPGSPCPAVPSIPCDDPCVSQAPPPPGCSEIPVPCPCDGDCSDGSTSPGGWPFAPSATAHPRDRATPRIGRQYPASIDEEDWVRLQAYVTNPACLPVCFVWTADKGHFEGAETLQPIYHAPATDRRDGETATIRFTVRDGLGGIAYDQIRIRIANTDDGGPAR